MHLTSRPPWTNSDLLLLPTMIQKNLTIIFQKIPENSGQLPRHMTYYCFSFVGVLNNCHRMGILAVSQFLSCLQLFTYIRIPDFFVHMKSPHSAVYGVREVMQGRRHRVSLLSSINYSGQLAPHYTNACAHKQKIIIALHYTSARAQTILIMPN